MDWKLFQASDFGVPQLRPRVVMVAIKREYSAGFNWPIGDRLAKSVGETLFDMMSANGWRGAKAWRDKAAKIAPTIVGGSKKHGGPDLGPTRARAAWAELGVEGRTIAETSPEKDFVGMPRLTVPMVAKLQGFPADWHFSGGKTAMYRQVGNAFPPPVAAAVGGMIAAALLSAVPYAVQAAE